MENYTFVADATLRPPKRQKFHIIPTSLNTADTLLCPFGERVYSLKLSYIISYVPNNENLFSNQGLFHLVIVSLFAWSLFLFKWLFEEGS